MKKTINKIEPILLVDDHNGIYIPQVFCQSYKAYITNLSEVKEDFEICLSGPDNEEYWDAWDMLLQNMKFTDDNSNNLEVGYLPESCDLWAFPENFDFSEYE